ncbi:hypothetical protein D3C86_1624930 [compost metagenome]
MHHVDGVIHGLDEVLDVATIKGSDEAPPDRKQHLAGDVIRLMLEGDDEVAVLLDVDAA